MDGRLDPDFAARALTTFIMRLNHMDTLHPHLIGDRRWREFIAERVAVMLGLQSPTRKRRHPRGAEYRVPTIDALLFAYHRRLARPGTSTERTLRRCAFPFRRELGRSPASVNERLAAGLDQIVGVNRWRAPQVYGWWSLLLPGFPTPGGWHVDGGQLRTSGHLTDHQHALVTLFLFSDV